jgi:hypothetical protein
MGFDRFIWGFMIWDSWVIWFVVYFGAGTGLYGTYDVDFERINRLYHDLELILII